MQFRRVVGSLLGGLALAAAIAAPALAEEPPQLGSSRVLDTAGALDDVAGAEAAIEAAFDRTGVSLFVVVVGSFENPSNADSWTTDTAELNNLGTGDVLLAIAVDDRAYRWDAETETLTDAQLDAMSARVEAFLADDDWDGAVQEAAHALADQLDPGVPVVPLAIGGVALAGVGALVVRGILRRRKGGDDVPVGELSQKDLDTRAGTLLVHLDDALKTSEQELGFAVAQFGEKATADFAAALSSARARPPRPSSCATSSTTRHRSPRLRSAR